MKTKVQETYRCDFCNKLYVRKTSAIIHEQRCKENPVNDRSCWNCIHLDKIGFEKEDYFERTYTVNVFYCHKRKVYLYPPICEYKNNMYDLMDDIESMPKTCNKCSTGEW